MVLNSEKLNNRCPNLQVVGSTHSPFVLVGAEKTAAFNLETGEMHEHLESREQFDGLTPVAMLLNAPGK